MRVLIVEDDERLAENIQCLLARNRHVGTIADNGQDAVFQIDSENFDMVILDWMLPDMSGIDVCKLIRQRGRSIPILMLTAKSQDDDVVVGLKSGADDYLAKPYSSEVLLARLSSLYRRRDTPVQSAVLEARTVTLDQNTGIVRRAGKIVQLAPKEYALLECFMIHQGKALDRMYLLEHVWGEHVDDFSNTVDVHVRYLRIKLGESLIKTVKGKGYMLCA